MDPDSASSDAVLAPETEVFAAAIAALNLPELIQVVGGHESSESSSAFAFSGNSDGSSSSFVIDEELVATLDAVGAAAIAWLRAYAELDSTNGPTVSSNTNTSSSPSSPTIPLPAGGVSSTQTSARMHLWDTFNAVCERPCKLLSALANKTMSIFMSTPATASLPSSLTTQAALAASKVYLALVTVPGAQAYGVFDAFIMRQALCVLKRYLELAAASGEEEGEGKGKGGGKQGGKGSRTASSSSQQRASAAASKRSRPGALDAAADPNVRRNPRREASSKSGAADDEDDEEQEDDEVEEEDGDKDVTIAATRGKRSASSRRAGSNKSSSAAMTFSSSDVSRVVDVLAALHGFLSTFPLRSQQEFIPQIVDLLAIGLTLPFHVVPAAVPREGESPEDNPLVASAACVLALLHPRHASPLTTARIILKKLKPFMLHGHAGTASAASSAAGTGGSGMKLSLEGGGDGDNLDGAFGGDNFEGVSSSSAAGGSPLVDLGRPAAPPDARTVRARALYMTRVVVSDKLSGQVSVVSPDADPSTVESIPNEVLVRLPAVTALLQHLSAGAVAARADVRAVTCDIIAHLRACLPHSLRRAFVRFVVKFGRASKAGYRLLAVEVAGRLLGASGGAGHGAAGVSEASALLMAGGDESSASASSASALAASSPILAIALSEMPVPSAADKILEAEGYGQDGYDYAGVGAEGEDGGKNNGNGEASGTPGDGPSSPGGGSVATGRTAGSTASSSRRRSSIIEMGADNARTPLRLGRGSHGVTPGTAGSAASRVSFGGASRGPGSPFYGPRGGAGAAARRRRSSIGGVSEFNVDDENEEGIDGCCDPRPTVTILLDFLYRRTSDKSPAVRAKAIAVLAAAVDPSLSPHARLLALLLTHVVHTAGVAAATAAGNSTSDVTLADQSIMSASVAAAMLSASSSSSSGGGAACFRGIALPAGVSVIEASGASPLVPLLVRRMADGKPAVRKAAVQAAVALALSGGAHILHASGQIQEGCGEGGVDNSDIPWSTAQALHAGVYQAAKIVASADEAAAAASTEEGASASASAPLVSGVLGVWALQTICSKATDSSILVRRAALSGIHALLLAEPTTPALQHLWLATVLPLVGDSEQTVSSRAVECAAEAIVDGLLSWHAAVKRREKATATSKVNASSAAAVAAAGATVAVPVLAWQLLDASAANSDLCRCLGAVVSALGRGGKDGSSGGNSSSSAAAAVAAAAASSSTGGLPLARLMAALQHGASATETRVWNPHDGGMVMAPLDADVPVDIGGTTADGSAATSAMADADSAAGSSSSERSGGRLTAATFRRASWLMLELLATHCAAKTVNGGGMQVAAAGTVDGAAAFHPMVPFLIRSWGTMLRSIRAANRIAEGLNTTADGDAGVAAGSLEQLYADASRVVRIFTLIAPALKSEDASGLVRSVVTDLQAFSWEPILVSAGTRMAAVASASHAGRSVAAATEAWASPIVSAAESLLRNAVSRPARMDNDRVSMALFTLGELSLVALDADAGQGVNDVAASSSSSSSSASSSSEVSASAAAGSSTASFRRLAPVFIPESVLTLVQALLVPSLTPTSAANGPASASTRAVPTSDGVRAHAYLCLGKLCLRDGSLAKRFVSVLVRDLSPSIAPAAVRNNILFVLGDMCVRYTALVDRHFSAMAECLADPAPVIRRHALLLLTQLVASDYLKMRGHLMYRFAAALADQDEDVRSTAADALTGALLVKDRKLLQSHFVDVVFVLTGCTSHPAYAHLVKQSGATAAASSSSSSSSSSSAAAAAAPRHNDDEEDEDDHAPSSSSNSSLVAAPSENAILRSLVMSDPVRRMHVYRTMLGAMAEEQRFMVHGKLALDVLGGLLEGHLSLTPRSKLAAMMEGGGQQQQQQRIRTLTPKAASLAGGEEEEEEEDSLPVAGGITWFPLGTTEALAAEVFAILSSPEIRGSAANGGGRKGGRAGNDEDEDAADVEEMAEGGAKALIVQSMEQAKSHLLEKVARKHVVENVVPICIGLKKMVASARSPLMGPLMGYLASLVRDYSEDVKEVLSADRQTAAELEFDLRMYTQGQMDAYGGIRSGEGEMMMAGEGTTMGPAAAVAPASAKSVRSTGGGGWLARAATTPASPRLARENVEGAVAAIPRSRGVIGAASASAASPLKKVTSPSIARMEGKQQKIDEVEEQENAVAVVLDIDAEIKKEGVAGGDVWAVPEEPVAAPSGGGGRVGRGKSGKGKAGGRGKSGAGLTARA